MAKKQNFAALGFSLLFLSLGGPLQADYATLPFLKQPEKNISSTQATVQIQEEFVAKSQEEVSKHKGKAQPAKPKCLNDSGGYFIASFLYWKTDENLNLVYKVTPLEGDREKTVAKPVDFDYEPGFKLGMGYRINEQAWDLFANWTWLRSHPHLSEHSTSSSFIISGIQSPTAGSLDFINASSAKAHGKFTFDSVDIELGKEYFIGKRISLRPFAGIKTAWVNQNVRIKFYNPATLNENNQNGAGSNLVLLPDIKEKLHNHTFGIGPRAGVNSRWMLGGSQFAFLANASASLLWEEYEFFGAAYIIGPNGVPRGGSVESEGNSIKPVAEGFLGFDWGMCLPKKTRLRIAAGYEMQYFWDQLEFAFGQVIDQKQALSLHGLTASVRFDF